ncbi:MAG: DUF1850 domain-containing protein [Armatimonadota bacterium]|nr:DUF1850 domain-containing protein [Armatimonadota bacterium]
MRRQALIALLGVGAFVVGALSLPTQRVLEVVDADTSRAILVATIREGESVILRYVHSLYGGLVWEVLRVRGTLLVLEELRAEREAALEYYQVEGKVTNENGRFRIGSLSLPVGEVSVRATGLGRRTLIWRGREIPLAGAGREGHLIRIQISRRSLLWLLLRHLVSEVP